MLLNKSLSFLFTFLFAQSLIGQFENITSEAGIIGTHRSVELLGGGAAFVDIDKDGWLDIVMTGGLNPDKLYLNNTDGTFRSNHNVLPQNNNPSKEQTSALAFGDINNDGCNDLVFTTLNRNEPNFILLNNCDGTFNRMNLGTEMGSSIGVSLLDFDRDGLLDIYIINYIKEPKFTRNEQDEVIGYEHECEKNYLYKNQGNASFLEVSQSLGAQAEGCALAVLGHQMGVQNEAGFYIANDFGDFIVPNEYLTYNSTQDSFIYKDNLGLNIGLFGMGIAIGDPDLDGDFDYFVTNIGPHAYLVNENDQYFDRAAERGVETGLNYLNESSTGWGAVFFDADNDGDEDLAVAKGYIPSADFLNVGRVDSCKLFLNNQSNFSDASDLLEGPLTASNRGVIYGDIDNDGDLDLMFATVSLSDDGDLQMEEYQLLRNDMAEEKNWITLQLEGIENNYAAIGSHVSLYSNGKHQQRIVYSGGTHASQVSNWVHFGVDEISVIDSIVIIWPDLTVVTYTNLAVNQSIRIQDNNPSSFDIVGCTDPNFSDYNSSATVSRTCSGTMTTSVYTGEKEEAIYFDYVNGILYLKNNLVGEYLDVHDVLGRRIKRFTLKNSVEELIQLNELPTGFYSVTSNMSNRVRRQLSIAILN